jgi:hypothetical protein
VQTLLSSTRGDGSPLCSPQEIVDGSCDAGELGDGGFEPRPTGGTSLFEGSLEVRFPLGGQLWEAATFVDFGQVWGQDARRKLGDLEITPGFGVRYFSPIGPIRVDLAYRFGGGQRSQVVTSAIRSFDPARGDREEDRLLGPDGARLDYVRADTRRDLALLDPRVLWGDLPPLSLRRFQLHLSIGQAF